MADEDTRAILFDNNLPVTRAIVQLAYTQTAVLLVCHLAPTFDHQSVSDDHTMVDHGLRTHLHHDGAIQFGKSSRLPPQRLSHRLWLYRRVMMRPIEY